MRVNDLLAREPFVGSAWHRLAELNMQGAPSPTVLVVVLCLALQLAATEDGGAERVSSGALQGKISHRQPIRAVCTAPHGKSGGAYAVRCQQLSAMMEQFGTGRLVISSKTHPVIMAESASYELGICIKCSPPPEVAAKMGRVVVDIVDSKGLLPSKVPLQFTVLVQNKYHGESWRRTHRTHVLEHQPSFINETDIDELLPSVATIGHRKLKVLTVHEGFAAATACSAHDFLLVTRLAG